MRKEVKVPFCQPRHASRPFTKLITQHEQSQLSGLLIRVCFSNDRQDMANALGGLEWGCFTLCHR